LRVIVKENWAVTDRWWTDEPDFTEWVAAIWYGREITFYKRQDEDIWRIANLNKKEKD
jgi:hypothetical protein